MDIRYTRHALDRMAEMGVSPAVVEDILHRPSVTRPSRDLRIATSDRHPGYGVVFDPHEPTGPYVVITLVFRTYDRYAREGETYRKD